MGAAIKELFIFLSAFWLVFAVGIGSMCMISTCADFAAKQYNAYKNDFKETLRQEVIATLQYEGIKK